MTIDDDLMRELREEGQRQGVTLNEIVDRVLRAGLLGLRQPQPPNRPYRCPTFSMGLPQPGSTSLDKALSLASLAEDEERRRKLEP